jgi:hypothetical protein
MNDGIHKIRLVTDEYVLHPANVYRVLLKNKTRLYTRDGNQYVHIPNMPPIQVNKSAGHGYCDVGFYSKYGIFEQE